MPKPTWTNIPVDPQELGAEHKSIIEARFPLGHAKLGGSVNLGVDGAEEPEAILFVTFPPGKLGERNHFLAMLRNFVTEHLSP